MKKKMIALLAGLMLTISAGSAFAAFSGTDELYMAAYDTVSNTEVVIDLGSLTLSGGKYSLTSSGVNSFNLGTNMPGASAANVQVAFFGEDGQGKNVLASASPTVTPTSSASQVSNFQGKISFINAQYTGGTALGVGTASATNSYAQQMSGVIAGSFGGLNGPTAKNWSTPEMSLASLASGGSLGIYSFAYTTKGQPAALGVLQFTDTLIAGPSGTYTVAAANATPIPAAIYLMGSGLLGMFGLRRKQRG